MLGRLACSLVCCGCGVELVFVSAAVLAGVVGAWSGVAGVCAEMPRSAVTGVRFRHRMPVVCLGHWMS